MRCSEPSSRQCVEKGSVSRSRSCAPGRWSSVRFVRSASGLGFDELIDPRDLRNAVLAGLELVVSAVQLTGMPAWSHNSDHFQSGLPRSTGLLPGEPSLAGTVGGFGGNDQVDSASERLVVGVGMVVAARRVGFVVGCDCRDVGVLGQSLSFGRGAAFRGRRAAAGTAGRRER